MSDNQIISALKKVLENNLPDFGLNNFEISRSVQPTDQYISGSADSNIKTQIFIHRVANQLIQNAPIEKVVGGDDLSIEYIYIHNRSAIIEFDIVHYFDHTDIKAMSCIDVAELISDVLFDRTIIDELRKDKIRLEQRSSIRPAYIINESERFESFTSFDIELTYQTVRRRKVRKVKYIKDDILYPI